MLNILFSLIMSLYLCIVVTAVTLSLFCFALIDRIIFRIFFQPTPGRIYINFSPFEFEASKRLHNVAIIWGKTLMSLAPSWTTQILGKEHLDVVNRGCVIVANHESATDILAIYLLGIQFRWMAKASAFKVPLAGRAMKWAGYVPVIRGNKASHQKALETSSLWLKNDMPMLFFPEGTRSTLGFPQPFKIGAFKLAKENNVPVLPIVLYGAGNLLRKGSLVPRKATIKIKVLAPVFPHEDESIDELSQRVYKIICDEHKVLTA